MDQTAPIKQQSADGVLTCGAIEEAVLRRTDWRSKSTRQGYEALVVQLKGYADGDFAEREVDEEFCRGFTNYLLANVKPTSARSYLEKLRTLTRQMKKRGEIATTPLDDIGSLLPRAEEVEKVYLTKEELEMMRRAACPAESTKRAFLFSCYTGLLKGEVKELQWDAIRWSGNGLVLVRPLDGDGGMVKVPLIEPARGILSEQERDYAKVPTERRDDHVFHLPSNTTISAHLSEWAREAGVKKDINYMTSRHTFATMALRAGVDLYVVAKWCGYSNVGTAQVYADLIGRAPADSGTILESAFA